MMQKNEQSVFSECVERREAADEETVFQNLRNKYDEHFPSVINYYYFHCFSYLRSHKIQILTRFISIILIKSSMILQWSKIPSRVVYFISM
jgi:hypothetical protein